MNGLDLEQDDLTLRSCGGGILSLNQWPLTTAIIAIMLFGSQYLATAPAVAQTKTYCSEPVTPFCVNRAGVFEDSTTAERCHLEVNKYVKGLEQFATCLGQQQQEARERAAAIKERFACMARGETDCR